MAQPELIEFSEYPNPAVSVIIPIYEGAELTKACLESIRDHTTHVSYEVIVVNDGDDLDIRQLLDTVRGVRVIDNSANLGYVRSVNYAASLARGRWLMLMNNDTEATDGWLRAMLECAESTPDVGVVTPKYLYPDGSLSEAGGITWRDGTAANYGRGDDPTLFYYEYRREVDYGSAAALMVRADLWRAVGGFDERFLPMYYEDTDLCFSARDLGFRVLYEPRAVVIHVEGGTAGVDLEGGYKRHQEENRPSFVTKWRERLESEQLARRRQNLRIAANRHRGPHVLVIDHTVPTWDRDSGSLRMLGILEALSALGSRVTFMGDNLACVQPYTRILQAAGIEVMYGSVNVNAELATIGPRLSMAILSRPHPASRWLDTVREFAPAATVVYDTVDLHWLRQARQDGAGTLEMVTVGENGSAPVEATTPKARALRELELAMIRATDVTFVTSEAERSQVERDVPGAKVLLIPNVHEIAVAPPGPADRGGVLFVGSFAHPPNIGAAVRLVRDVMPLVWQRLPNLTVTIVGADPPAEVQALASPLVDVAGWVKDLQPLLDASRVLVAPLWYGAGLKGKVTQALAAGLPVVTTPVGAEGMAGLDRCVLVGNDPATVAAHVIHVSKDDELWRHMATAGRALIAETCSPAVIRERLAPVLEVHDRATLWSPLSSRRHVSGSSTSE
jgi:GT2 family glycosyltransferase/glycosyltransferase involved in cell wall biosynthesis